MQPRASLAPLPWEGGLDVSAFSPYPWLPFPVPGSCQRKHCGPCSPSAAEKKAPRVFFHCPDKSQEKLKATQALLFPGQKGTRRTGRIGRHREGGRPPGGFCFAPRAPHAPGKETGACGQPKLGAAQPSPPAALHLGAPPAASLKTGTRGQQPGGFAAGVGGGALRNTVGKGKDPCHQPAPGHQADERSSDGSGWEGGGRERGVPKDGLGTLYPVPRPQAPSAHQSELGTNARGRASQRSPRKHRSALAGHPHPPGHSNPF